MGYYIETDSFKGKASWLASNIGAMALEGRPTEVAPGYVPVCVADNGPFEAAAIAFDPREANAFDSPQDTRPRQWLLIKTEDAERLCPRVKGHINWNKP